VRRGATNDGDGDAKPLLRGVRRSRCRHMCDAGNAFPPLQGGTVVQVISSWLKKAQAKSTPQMRSQKAQLCLISPAPHSGGSQGLQCP